MKTLKTLIKSTLDGWMSKRNERKLLKDKRLTDRYIDIGRMGDRATGGNEIKIRWKG